MDDPSAAAPVAAHAAPHQRRRPTSGWLLTAAVVLFVMGALSILGALLIGVVIVIANSAWAMFERLGATDETLGALTGVIALFGVVLGVVGLLHIVAGAGVLRRSRPWGRVLGMVVALLGSVLMVVSTAWSLVPMPQLEPVNGEPLPPLTGAEIAVSIGTTVVAVGAYVLVIVVLLRRRDEFDG